MTASNLVLTGLPTQPNIGCLFRLQPPSKDEVLQFISQPRHSTFSYPEVGASAATKLPEGYNIDRNGVLLGRGELIWRRAVQAIREWHTFNMPWVHLYWPTSSIEVGANVAVLINHFGFCSLNPARIVYLVDEEGPVFKYGFAYGTLEEHSERGEEPFYSGVESLRRQGLVQHSRILSPQ